MTLDHLLKKSGVFDLDAHGQPIGLSLPVLNNETPGVMDALPNDIANPRTNARNKGVYNPGLVNRIKEKKKGISYHKQKQWEYADRSLIKPDPKAKKPWEFGGGEWSPDKAPKATRPGDSSSDDDDDDLNLPRELRNLPKALRRSILQQEGRLMVQQPTPQPSNNNQEWVGFDDAAPANDAGPSSSSAPGGASDAPAPDLAAPPGQPSRASTFSITDLPDDDDDDDNDDVVVQDMSFGLGDGPSSAPGAAACAPRSGVGPMCVDGQPAEGVVTDEDGAACDCVPFLEWGVTRTTARTAARLRSARSPTAICTSPSRSYWHSRGATWRSCWRRHARRRVRSGRGPHSRPSARRPRRRRRRRTGRRTTSRRASTTAARIPGTTSTKA